LSSRKPGLEQLKAGSSLLLLLLTASRGELLCVRDEIAGINQHLHTTDVIDQAAFAVLMDPYIEPERLIDI
jgi:hypothetical protein